MLSRLLPLLVLAAVVPCAAQAAAPPLVPITGYLTDDAGLPIDGTVTMHFKLYPGPSGATILFQETQGVDVDNGQFTAYVGNAATLDLALFRDNPTVYLGMAIDTGNELAPRLEMATAPYAAFAQYADDADMLGGLDASEYRQISDTIDWTDVVSVPASLADGVDADTTYTAGTGLTLAGTTFSADRTAIEGWASGVCYDDPAELRAELDAVYAARQLCGANQVLMADSAGNWTCTNTTALPLSEAAIDTAVANNGYAAVSALTTLTGRVTTAETNISTLQSGLTTTNGNVTTVSNNLGTLSTAVSAMATPGTLNASSNPVDYSKLKNAPTGGVRNLGYAMQNAVVAVNTQTWTDIPGATTTFTVPAGGLTLRLSATGGLHSQGGSPNYTHCGIRFVLDGTPYGDGSWGDMIEAVQASPIGVGWHENWTAFRDIPSVTAGTHTVKLQLTGWGASSSNCYIDTGGYMAARLRVEGY